MRGLRPKNSIVVRSKTPTLADSIATMEKECDIAVSMVEVSSDSSSSLATTPRTIYTSSTEDEKMFLNKQTTVVIEHVDLAEDMHSKENGTDYPSGLRLGLIVLAICLSILLMALELVRPHILLALDHI